MIKLTQSEVTYLKEILDQALSRLESNSLDPFRINISIAANVSLAGWLGESDPSDFANQYNVDIELYLDDNFEKKISIGHAFCFYISGYDYANNYETDLREIADSISGDLLTAVTPVLGQDGSLFDDYFGSNFLYIDEFFIQPDYRDKGIGTFIFPLLLDTLGRGAGAIAIIPTPTEDDGKTRIIDKDTRYNPVLNDMCKFIMRYGFFCADRANRVWVKNTAYAD